MKLMNSMLVLEGWGSEVVYDTVYQLISQLRILQDSFARNGVGAELGGEGYILQSQSGA